MLLTGGITRSMVWVRLTLMFVVMLAMSIIDTKTMTAIRSPIKLKLRS